MDKGRITSDKGTHYMREVLHWQTGEPTGRRQRVQRYLCIGGPLGGIYRSSEEIADEQPGRYLPFNNGGSSKHSMIFVHDELVP